ncbi:D-sedoheptulose-7-phosphate isomerase [Thiomicrospira microaerophila]|uniref:D-sedoheptulose-7-phosphate isomerase n=1 Tax=Thiomicrospira microaerophila TaxID=406020 RepID=UPI0005C8028D|nr:SIS domain-containing protein [Thiomicrospira microaerophila]
MTANAQSYNDALMRHLDLFKHAQAYQPMAERMLSAILHSLQQGGKIFWCGNGGSAADSQHLAAELVVRYKQNRQALASIALTTDTSILTACANDFGFEYIFARQVSALMGPNDILVALSTSGNSQNVNRAVDAANQLGATTLALTGGDGGQLAQIAQHVLRVESDETARIQEMHLFIGHWWCEALDGHCLQGDLSEGLL